MHKKLTIDEDTRGKRFDVAATEMLPMLSRAYVHVLIAGKRILLNGEQQKAGYKLRVGDVITTDFDASEIDQIADIDLPILYEDDNVLVINKPEGVISHSRGRYWNEPSVASFIRQKTHLKTATGSYPIAGERAGIVHRLDRATSGVMICAKNAETLSLLQKQFSERKVKKTYMAVVKGHMKPAEAIIDMPIERNPKAPSTFRVGANGKQSQTKYTVVESREDYDLVKLEPVTGRTHQLRVHLTHQKHPIVGDTLYNGEPADRLLLHAFSLEITLPGNERKTFEAPLPEAFKTVGKS
ncbi:MAG TPA: RluA family pseudouridine synthase [Candidatus Limnocylindria bacterium]|nr:RluA family pseudouridine synthase [Candidatus Limnocylindria bacterium]